MPSHPPSDTRLRFGKLHDLPAIGRLVDRANVVTRVPHLADVDLAATATRGHLLVLQLHDDEVAAAACIAPGRGLVYLVMDPEVSSPALEHRMIGVADALYASERRVPRAARCARGRR